MFSRLTDRALEVHFRKDQNGRLVFIPFGLKQKCYFIDSKSDEDKIRAFVRMYWSAIQLISWVSFPSIYIPAVILEDYAGLSTRGHRMAISLGIPLFFWLILGTLAWMLWAVYKKAVPAVTSSLSEAGPDTKNQLSEISRPRRRIALGALVAAMGFLILATIAVLGLTMRK